VAEEGGEPGEGVAVCLDDEPGSTVEIPGPTPRHDPDTGACTVSAGAPRKEEELELELSAGAARKAPSPPSSSAVATPAATATAAVVAVAVADSPMMRMGMRGEGEAGGGSCQLERILLQSGTFQLPKDIPSTAAPLPAAAAPEPPPILHEHPPPPCEYYFELGSCPPSCPPEMGHRILGGIREGTSPTTTSTAGMAPGDVSIGGGTVGFLQGFLLHPTHSTPSFRILCARLDRKLLECAAEVCDQNGRLKRNGRLQHDHRGGFLCVTALGLHPQARVSTRGRGRGALTGAVLALLVELRGHVEVCCVERAALDCLGEPGSHEEEGWAAGDFQAVDQGEGHWVILCAR